MFPSRNSQHFDWLPLSHYTFQSFWLQICQFYYVYMYARKIYDLKFYAFMREDVSPILLLLFFAANKYRLLQACRISNSSKTNAINKANLMKSNKSSLLWAIYYITFMTDYIMIRFNSLLFVKVSHWWKEIRVHYSTLFFCLIVNSCTIL